MSLKLNNYTWSYHLHWQHFTGIKRCVKWHHSHLPMMGLSKTKGHRFKITGRSLKGHLLKLCLSCTLYFSQVTFSPSLLQGKQASPISPRKQSSPIHETSWWISFALSPANAHSLEKSYFWFVFLFEVIGIYYILLILTYAHCWIGFTLYSELCLYWAEQWGRIWVLDQSTCQFHSLFMTTCHF